ncbi:hypothetical protein ACFSTC_50740 [Nonomuraea ferruginea]
MWRPSADLRDLRSLPALIVAGPVDELVDDLASAVIPAVCPAGSERLDDRTVALLAYGLPGFAVDPSGGLCTCRSCGPARAGPPASGSTPAPHRPRRVGVPAPALDPRVLVRPRGRTRRLAGEPAPLLGPGVHHPTAAPRGRPGEQTSDSHDQPSKRATARDGQAADGRDRSGGSGATRGRVPAARHGRAADGGASGPVLPQVCSLLRVEPARDVLLGTLKATGNPHAHGRARLAAETVTLRLVEATGLGSEAKVHSPLLPSALTPADLLERPLPPTAPHPAAGGFDGSVLPKRVGGSRTRWPLFDPEGNHPGGP